jgi:hypothetical protein
VGALLWTDVLSTQADWKTLCEIGKKVEGAAGIGGELQLQLRFSDETGKFYFNFHAGLVLGVGASGSFTLEVETANILEMIHFVYKALGDVDYRYLELFDPRTESFVWYQKLAVYALGTGVSFTIAAARLTDSGIGLIDDFYDEFVASLQGDWKREQLGAAVAENLLEDVAAGESSVLLHSPPEVKGQILELLTHDFGLTPKLIDGTFTKVRAIGLILQSFQSWRDFEESVVRMNPDGASQPERFDTNVARLFRFIGKNAQDYNLFRRILIGKTANLVGPVRQDPHAACRSCGIV